MNVKLINIVEGPSYIATCPEDGPYTTWNLYVVVQDFHGDDWTHQRAFERNDLATAERLVERIKAVGTFSLQYWVPGHPWDEYKYEQTPEQERQSWRDAGIY